MSEILDVDFTEHEVAKAISQLPNGKTCGNDGIPVKWYKMFWPKIKNIFMELINDVQQNNHLHQSALLGVVNLIPKQTKDTRFLKHLCPITLLNSDYKIMEKMIANRLEPALEYIISEQQRGFMKGRRISVNIRMIYELIKATNDTDQDAMILSLDFLKCFDRVEFQILFKVLDFLEFPHIIKHWTKILYTNFKVVTQKNGHFSKRISINRGLHQGGPCSSLYFLLCAEVMALLLENPDIKGIMIEEIKHLLGQYADDSDMYLLKDQKSLDSVFLVIERFKSMSGFALNYDKTVIMRIGSLANTDETLLTQKTVSWTNEPINVLGVLVGTNIKEVTNMNYNAVLNSAMSVFRKWENQTLSLIGKVLVVNTLISSLFVYKMSAIPSMTKQMYKVMKEEIQKFIWNGARPKIKYDYLIMKRKGGGLGLCDLEVKDKALKVVWVQILANENSLKNVVYANIAPDLKQFLWSCSLNSEHVRLFITDPFWATVCETWFQIKRMCDNLSDIYSEIIWLNSQILINGKPVFLEE